jgi:hypothetical protein
MKMNSIKLTTKYLFVFLIVISLSSVFIKTVSAHIPFISNDNHNSAQSSLVVYDIAVSKVIYQKLTDDSPESWISFKANQGEVLYFNLGIPLLEELKDFRPSIGLITPSSERPSVNSLKESLIFPTLDISDPKTFYEPYTKTNSWTFTEHKFNIPKTGNYSLVTYSPKKQVGKVWVSIGKEERFGPSDWITIPAKIPEIRKFHSPSIEAPIVESEIGSENRNGENYWMFLSGGIAICCLMLFLLRRFFIRIFHTLNKS